MSSIFQVAIKFLKREFKGENVTLSDIMYGTQSPETKVFLLIVILWSMIDILDRNPRHRVQQISDVLFLFSKNKVEFVEPTAHTYASWACKMPGMSGGGRRTFLHGPGKNAVRIFDLEPCASASKDITNVMGKLFYKLVTGTDYPEHDAPFDSPYAHSQDYRMAKLTDSKLPKDVIEAVIGLLHPHACGSLALSCAYNCIVATNMLKEK